VLRSRTHAKQRALGGPRPKRTSSHLVFPVQALDGQRDDVKREPKQRSFLRRRQEQVLSAQITALSIQIFSSVTSGLCPPGNSRVRSFGPAGCKEERRTAFSRSRSCAGIDTVTIAALALVLLLQCEFQIEVANQTVQIVRVDAEQSCRFREFPFGLVHGGEDELAFQLAHGLVIRGGAHG
jgi:hypothetical protein